MQFPIWTSASVASSNARGQAGARWPSPGLRDPQRLDRARTDNVPVNHRSSSGAGKAGTRQALWPRSPGRPGPRDLGSARGADRVAGGSSEVIRNCAGPCAFRNSREAGRHYTILEADGSLRHADGWRGNDSAGGTPIAADCNHPDSRTNCGDPLIGTTGTVVTTSACRCLTKQVEVTLLAGSPGAPPLLRQVRALATIVALAVTLSSGTSRART